MSVDVYFLEAIAGIGAVAASTLQVLNRQHKKSVQRIVDENIKKDLPGLIKTTVEGSVRDAIHPVDLRLAKVEGQMDVFKEISIDIAKVLHHPEPDRKPVDDLLDKFLDGSITDDEADRLRGYLTIIRDWEPGISAPFTVFPGEQVAAAILLHTMKHALNRGNDD